MDPNNQQPYQQPNQPPQQGYSIDYLDQIAPKKPSVSGPKKILFIAGGVIALLVTILVVGLLFTSGTKSTGQVAIDLSAQLDTLRDISKEQQNNLRNNVLRNYNGSLTLQLTNASTDLKAALEAEGIDAEKLSKEQQAAQELFKTELDEKFENASLNIQLDRTYAREIAYQLNVIDSMIASVGERANNELITEFVQDNKLNLQAIAKNFNEFNSAK